MWVVFAYSPCAVWMVRTEAKLGMPECRAMTQNIITFDELQHVSANSPLLFVFVVFSVACSMSATIVSVHESPMFESHLCCLCDVCIC